MIERGEKVESNYLFLLKDSQGAHLDETYSFFLITSYYLFIDICDIYKLIINRYLVVVTPKYKHLLFTGL